MGVIGWSKTTDGVEKKRIVSEAVDPSHLNAEVVWRRVIALLRRLVALREQRLLYYRREPSLPYLACHIVMYCNIIAFEG
jgi:hypothetical protein